MKSDKELTYSIKENGINELIEERNNMVTMLREVAWGKREHHLEIRKWVIDVDNEKPMKGVSFMTPEAPHNLSEILVENGFGNSSKLIKSLSKREDFDESLVSVVGKKKVEESKNKEVVVSKDEFFDPKSILS